MRVVFAGTAEFAVPSLRVCAEQHDVCMVITQPDRPGKRGKPAPRPIAIAAKELELDVWQPEKIRDAAVVERILAMHADVLVVVAYGQIIPVSLLEGHRYGGVNVHASVLPRWRGAAPIAAAILEGDTTTGVCITKMEAGLDTGPVYAVKETVITPQTTTTMLTDELMITGAELLGNVLAALERGDASPVPQDAARATLAPRWSRADAAFQWDKVTAVDVDRRVRALWPWPGVTAPLGGQEIAILAGELSEQLSDVAAGMVVGQAGEGVDVMTTNGTYRVTTVQPPGKRPMSAAAYLRGVRQ